MNKVLGGEDDYNSMFTIENTMKISDSKVADDDYLTKIEIGKVTITLTESAKSDLIDALLQSDITRTNSRIKITIDNQPVGVETPLH